MKVAIFLANGFEEVEAISPIDILKRSGAQVDIYSVSDSKVVGSHGIIVEGQTFDNIDLLKEGYDAVILPGGSVGVQNLLRTSKIHQPIVDFFNKGKLVCAICAAPMVLGMLGILKNRRYTCYAGCNEGLDGLYTAKEIEVDGNLITARSMLYSLSFGLTISEKLFSEEVSERVRKQIEGLNRK